MKVPIDPSHRISFESVRLFRCGQSDEFRRIQPPRATASEESNGLRPKLVANAEQILRQHPQHQSQIFCQYGHLLPCSAAIVRMMPLRVSAMSWLSFTGDG
jgi:hypothetical protein